MNSDHVQLDQYRIVIRERSLSDLLDLALCVVRVHGLPLLGLLALGAVPAAVLNDIWLTDEREWVFLEDFPSSYLFWNCFLIVAEIPLVTSLMTLYLGQTLFQQRIRWNSLFADWFRSLPQLLIFQGLLRVPLALIFLAWPLLFAVWPYTSEVILLERNPLWARRGQMSTARRIRALHSGWVGELFGRWICALGAGVLLAGSMGVGLYVVAGLLLNDWEAWETVLRLHVPLSLWLTVGFFAVVRFLSYLDLRIRREGWEVELLLRAEGARLARQLS
ncbi:MAG: hypothetical protein ACOY3P_13240 [Planctomycetota bacterium]